MKISLIIPTYNRPEALSECLLSLLKCPTQPDELIIVDQSNDESFIKNHDFLKKYFAEKLSANEIIHLKPSFQSLTAARNCGVANSTSEIVVFSDDDVEFMENTFSAVKTMFSDVSLAFIGAVDLLSLKQKFSPLSYLFDLKEINIFSRGYITKSCLGRFPKKINGTTKTQWGMGYCFALRKANMLEGNIWFDEKMKRYAYAEDLDFSMRFCRYSNNKGEKTIFSDSFCVKHHVSKEYRIPSIEFYLSFFGNRYYILNKNGLKKNIAFFNLANLGLKLILFTKKRKEEIAVFKLAHRIFKRNKKRIADGDLDYQRMISEWKE